MKITRKKIEQVANEAGWKCTITKKDSKWQAQIWQAEFESHTDYRGQDVVVDVSADKLEDLGKELYDYYEAYDPDYETSLWLGSDGHGKNGAPHNLSDILKDMKEAEQMIKELAKAVCTLSGYGWMVD